MGLTGDKTTRDEGDFTVNCDTDWDLIDDISKIREKNNELWMAILKLAFQYAPKEAKILMKQITENDAEINRLSKKLAGE